LSPTRRRARELSASTLSALLARLSPDPDRAGPAYEALRLSLVAFFTWRGAASADECADETIDRLGARLAEGLAVDDLPRFARGVARLVLLEHWRRPGARRGPLPESSGPQPIPGEEALQVCLERCLDRLDPADRALILDYYAAEGRGRIDTRRQLTQALGVSETALRSRALRLRQRLERCILDCLEPGAPATGDTDA
jgi:DNA-directed RNA polymerase specialized sigma24 family protein